MRPLLDHHPVPPHFRLGRIVHAAERGEHGDLHAYVGQLRWRQRREPRVAGRGVARATRYDLVEGLVVFDRADTAPQPAAELDGDERGGRLGEGPWGRERIERTFLEPGRDGAARVAQQPLLVLRVEHQPPRSNVAAR